jgi:hypothetical protein
MRLGDTSMSAASRRALTPMGFMKSTLLVVRPLAVSQDRVEAGHVDATSTWRDAADDMRGREVFCGRRRARLGRGHT